MNKLARDFLAPYTSHQVGLMLTMAMEMEAYGLAAPDLVAAAREYFTERVSVVENKDRHSPDHEKKTVAVMCPQCGHHLSVSLVNVSKCTNIGGAWRTSLECRNPQCRFTELSTKTTQELKNNGI